MKRLLGGVVLALLLSLFFWSWGQSPVAAQSGSDCEFFTQTAAGQPGGFYVCDDAQAQFLSAFERWGLQRVGYPISQRYTRDGFVTQAFQKAIMQWRPNEDAVYLVNIFDDLHNDGFDERLLRVRQTPNHLEAGPEGPNASFEQAKMARQALLAERPALERAYFSVADPVLFFGLPTSEVEDMGNHYAIRLQRTVLQEWKESVPWASAGQVTVANGGDMAKELGQLPAAALVPVSSGTPPTPVTDPGLPQPPAANRYQPLPTPGSDGNPQPAAPRNQPVRQGVDDLQSQQLR